MNIKSVFNPIIHSLSTLYYLCSKFLFPKYRGEGQNFLPSLHSYCQSISSQSISQASDDINFYIVKTGDVSWNDNTHPVSCFTGNNSEDRVEPVEISIVQLSEGAVLFYLEFAVLQEIQQNALTLDRGLSHLEALAFGPQGAEMPLVLKNERFVRGVEMNLSPNPFTDATQLLIDMPEPDKAVLCIQDMAGATVSVRNLVLTSGRTEWPLTSEDFKNRTGVFTITLQTSSGTLSRKIVKF